MQLQFRSIYFISNEALERLRFDTVLLLFEILTISYYIITSNLNSSNLKVCSVFKRNVFFGREFTNCQEFIYTLSVGIKPWSTRILFNFLHLILFILF